ncbi:MAG: hypothetical protein J0I40_14730 [Cellulomonas sp.]|uniref:hypothetical protein n=1 Tax=Cellulomonas sp. 73-92 TaxID=1895740 RepID=UPI00092B7B95|nr:hypothetical protein [Cellulomonas sp. 73-92]MBN9376609.1 hypothetical protein [Cellulomonas sp.]OJV76501.1 MAG: hypothetical protein BGO37_10615 [Cellulomonas sp. 73-92]
MTRTPAVRLDDDGRHILWSHECNFLDLASAGIAGREPSLWHPDVLLPLNDDRGWRVESTDPLTVSPSILCGSCGTHGFWRDGRWISA